MTVIFLIMHFFFSSFTGKALWTHENAAYFFTMMSKSKCRTGMIQVCDCSTWKAEGRGLPQFLV